MKAMCISQPWASLVCAGLEDVINRPWKPKENPGRMLIVALNVEIPQNYADLLPACWTYRIDNYIAMNQMPAIDSLPHNVILGYVDVEGFTEKEESIWSLPDCWGWKLKNAHIFKNPIPCDKENEFLIDIDDIDPDNLPETIDILQPTADGDELVLPLSSKKFDSLLDGNKELDLNIYEDNRDFFTTYAGKIWNPRQFKTLRAIAPDGTTARFQIDNVQLVLERDDNQYPLKIEKRQGWEYLYYVVYTLGAKL